MNTTPERYAFRNGEERNGTIGFQCERGLNMQGQTAVEGKAKRATFPSSVKMPMAKDRSDISQD